MEELLTVREVARALRCSKDFAYRLIKAGQIPALKIRSLKVRKSDLESFLANNVGKDLSDPENIKEVC